MKRKATVQDELQLKINVINARKTAGILTDLQETELSDKKRKVGGIRVYAKEKKRRPTKVKKVQR